MYRILKWLDHYANPGNTFTIKYNADGTVTLARAGEVIQQGTNMSASNFNNMENGIFDTHLANRLLSIAMNNGSTQKVTPEQIGAMNRNGYGYYYGNVDELKEAGTYVVISYAEGMSGTFPLSDDFWYTVEVSVGGTGSITQTWFLNTYDNTSRVFMRHFNGECWSVYLEPVSRSGGTFTGDVIIKRDYASWRTENAAGTRYGIVELSPEGRVNIYAYKDGNNSNKLVIDLEAEDLAKALWLSNKVDGVQNNYHIFGQHNFVINATSADYDMDAILLSGWHFAFYQTNGTTLGTPRKYEKTEFAEALILSYASGTSYGQQIAFLAGNIIMTRKLKGGAIGEWEFLYTESNPPYTYGTEDLTAGTSALETGKVYYVYE